MTGFSNGCKSTVKKSHKSKSKKNKNRNMKAVAKFRNGNDDAMFDLAMQYQLENALVNGNYSLVD